VGAIALGWLFAEGVTRFVGIFLEPISVLVAQRRYFEIAGAHSTSLGFPYLQAIVQALTAAAYLLVGYGLLRWLYYPPAEKQDQEVDSAPEQAE
jgi:hypothetical protein